MKKSGFFFLIIISLFGCNFEQEARAASNNIVTANKIWVFLHFNVPYEINAADQSNGIDSYYYYSNISERLYESITSGQLKEGFIYLENVKYWGENDLVYEYKDYENNGDLVFRIEDIKRIRRINREPIVGKGYEQFEEPKEPTKNKAAVE